MPFDDKYFGEGLTLLDDNRYIALTWLEKTFLFIDRKTLKILDEKIFPPGIKEGWGLTHSESYLYISEGSSTIFVIDKQNLNIVDKIKVKDKKGKDVSRVNELEYFKDPKTGKEYLWANVFLLNKIVKIDIESGVV